MAERYEDYGYRSPGPGSGAAGRALAARFVAIADRLAPRAHVCDLGCGNGYLAAQLAARGHRVTGVDASASGIAVALAHYRADNLRFIRESIDAPDLERLAGAGTFDLVVSSDVVEHLYKPSSLLASAARLLKPDGWLVLGTPYHGWLKNVAISALGRWDAHHAPNWDGGHIKFFSPASLGELVARNGFSVERFEFHGRAPWLWKNMICVARKHGG